MTKGYGKKYIYDKGKGKGKGKGKRKGKGKSKDKYLKLKEENNSNKKKRQYVFTNITLKNFLKDNDVNTRISKESFTIVENKTKKFVLDLINKSNKFLLDRCGKTLSANDVMNATKLK